MAEEEAPDLVVALPSLAKIANHAWLRLLIFRRTIGRFSSAAVVQAARGSNRAHQPVVADRWNPGLMTPPC